MAEYRASREDLVKEIRAADREIEIAWANLNRYITYKARMQASIELLEKREAEEATQTGSDWMEPEGILFVTDEYAAKHYGEDKS